MQDRTDDHSSAPANWQYKPDDAEKSDNRKTDHDKPISWTASEFIAHQKTAGWYVLLALAGVVGSALIYVLTKDKISAFMGIIVMVALGFAASRKPRTLEYELDGSGIRIAQKTYFYNNFKAFSVIDEGAISSIELLPLKRLMPSISLYYDPKDETRITDMLSQHLPYQEGQKDPIDRFLHKIRF